MVPEIRYAKSGDVHIAYQVVGNGPLDLIFVMGWISHLDYLWDGPGAPFLNRLASFSRLITFDKRGTGLSDRSGDLPTIEQRMDDVRAVMDAAGSKRAALLGISEGAAMCALFAATYPERTSALVMYGAYARRVWHPDYPWAPTIEQRQEFFDAIESGWGGVVDLDTLAPSTVDDESFRQWWARYLQRSASPGAALALARMNGEIDIRHVLQVIRTPTLILHRTGDLDIDVGGARYMAGQIPNATFVELPGDDHLVFAGDQESVLSEIELFLTGVRPEPEADGVLAAILCVEIVEAMVVAARMGDSAWRQAIVEHELLVNSALTQFRGRLVRRTATGFVAIFDGPARAIRCSLAIAAGSRAKGLNVRSGLHSGECDRDLSEMRGVAYQVAARVMSRANADEILVSRTVTDLVAGAGIRFFPVDRHLVTGRQRDLELFRVAESPTDDVEQRTTSRDSAVSANPLSPREREVANLIGGGMTNREIADELSISVATVERHASNIFTKLGMRSRSQVAGWIFDHDRVGKQPQ